MQGNCGECEHRWSCEINPEKCNEWPDPVPMTNADRIRAMSDAELADFLGQYKFCDMCVEGCDACTYHGECDKRLLEWLQQPYKEDD